MLEVDAADTLGAQAVGEGAGDLLGGELYDLALTQAGLGVGGELGLNTDHFDFGICELDGGGHAAD